MKRTRLRDLADATGFSVSTVSAVLRQQHAALGITRETVRLIEETAARLRYIPQTIAQAMVRGRHDTLLAVFDADPQRAPWLGEMLWGALQAADAARYGVSITVASHTARLGDGLAIDTLGRVDGVLFLNSAPHSGVDDLERSGIPAVRWGRGDCQNEVALRADAAARDFWARMKVYGCEKLHVWTPMLLGKHRGVGFLDTVLKTAPVPWIEDVLAATPDGSSASASAAAIDRFLNAPGRNALISIRDNWVLDLALAAQTRGVWQPGRPLPWPVLSYEATAHTQQLFGQFGVARLDLQTRELARAGMALLIERIAGGGATLPARWVDARIVWADETKSKQGERP